ncbi:MAG: hypothetical protein Q8N35_01150 [Methylococcaceae bacterium]|nr:hypothetical protein [Methylococcaceae bacterium]MDZ4156456.1 hypothetical protein [Methylococcales bacterium]MDP2391672.1 hypothetical protein [Methylococcaceae bacterium]MDP3018171.1 hypothetical protein [Methylococcaceae bacterium]MDP3389384.1 hypothetical protein [Methylococcaceae bacterium]
MKSTLAGLQIWGAPILLGLITAAGLLAALLSDGIGDMLSWLAIAVPVAVGIWHGGRR